MDKIDHCRKIVKEQISYTAFEQNKFLSHRVSG